MASTSKSKLIETAGFHANATGDSTLVVQNAKSLVGVLTVTNKSATTVSIGGTIEHSPDSVTWATLCTFSAVTTNAADIQQITGNCLPYIRGKATFASTVTTVQTSPSALAPLAGGSATSKASLTIQNVIYTAKTVGSAGNSITVEWKDTGIGGLGITTVGNAITVDFGGDTPTADQVVAKTSTLVDIRSTAAVDVNVSLWYDLSR